MPKVQHFVGKRPAKKPQKLHGKLVQHLSALAVGKSITVRNLTLKQWRVAAQAVQEAQKHIRKRYTTRSVSYNPKNETRTIRIWRII